MASQGLITKWRSIVAPKPLTDMSTFLERSRSPPRGPKLYPRPQGSGPSALESGRCPFKSLLRIWLALLTLQTGFYSVIDLVCIPCRAAAATGCYIPIGNAVCHGYLERYR